MDWIDKPFWCKLGWHRSQELTKGLKPTDIQSAKPENAPATDLPYWIRWMSRRCLLCGTETYRYEYYVSLPASASEILNKSKEMET